MRGLLWVVLRSAQMFFYMVAALSTLVLLLYGLYEGIRWIVNHYHLGVAGIAVIVFLIYILIIAVALAISERYDA